MANCCENIIKIWSKDKNLLEKIQDEVREDFLEDGETVTILFSFTKICPIPEEPGNLSLWTEKNWGTSKRPSYVDMEYEWDDEDYVELGSGKGTLTYKFNSAWSPPEGIYRTLIEKYPEIKGNISWFYNEPQMEFAGYLNRDIEKEEEREG